MSRTKIITVISSSSVRTSFYGIRPSNTRSFILEVNGDPTDVQAPIGTVAVDKTTIPGYPQKYLKTADGWTLEPSILFSDNISIARPEGTLVFTSSGIYKSADSNTPSYIDYTSGGGGGGAISDGDKGDITVSASGATWTIDDAVVSFAKLQNLTSDKLIGRDAGGSGVATEISVGGGLEFTGTDAIQRSALTGDVTSSAGSDSTTISNDAVTFAKMQNVSTDIIVGRDSSGSGDLTEISVSGGLEFTGSNAIQRSALTGDVTASTGSNSTTIANDAVTFAKIQNISTDTLIGRDAASTGDTTEISVSGGLEFTGSNSIQRSALTGDITASAGSNATTIANAIVTFAKIQNITNNRLLGRNDAADGSIQHISVGTGLSLSSNILSSIISQYTDENAQDAVGLILDSTLVYSDATPSIGRAALTGDVTASAGSNATTIANDVVTFAKMQNIASSRILGRTTVLSGDIEELTVTLPLKVESGALSINDVAPISHADSHKDGGIDEIATETPSANEIVKASGTGKIAIGWLPFEMYAEEAEVDFGATETPQAFIFVPAGYVSSTSKITCQCIVSATTDHDPEDVILEGLQAYSGNIQNGVGFDIYVHAPNNTWGKYKIQAVIYK